MNSDNVALWEYAKKETRIVTIPEENDKIKNNNTFEFLEWLNEKRVVETEQCCVLHKKKFNIHNEAEKYE